MRIEDPAAGTGTGGTAQSLTAAYDAEFTERHQKYRNLVPEYVSLAATYDKERGGSPDPDCISETSIALREQMNEMCFLWHELMLVSGKERVQWEELAPGDIYTVPETKRIYTHGEEQSGATSDETSRLPGICDFNCVNGE